MTFDPPLTELDRFTYDIEEKDGITGANFTGTGHAYGLRALIVGGLEGVPPTTADASGIRIGRYVPRQIGSPCMAGDRAIVVGSVQEAQLSNNLSNAAAAASETDAGTITDVRQPTQRCYPKPRVEQGPGEIDPFGPLYPVLPGKEYPRPVDTDGDDDGISDSDERAGMDWPFGIAQCASGGTDTKRTKPKLLDRGDDLPSDVRQKELELEGFRADVTCDLEGENVEALAEAGPFEQQDLDTKNVPKVKPSAMPSGAPVNLDAVPEPSEVDFIRVAEASSYSQVKRVKGLGLVSESFAYVRGVNIGDKVFIDGAFTYARARAAGRPGTAATDFVRRLCGVRIPELNMHVSAIDVDLAPVQIGDPVHDRGGDIARNGIELPPLGDSLPSRIDLPDTGTTPPGLGIPRDSIPRRVDVPHQDLGEIDPLNPDSDDQQVDDRQVNDICGDPGLQQAGSQPVVDAINRVLGSRGRVSAPNPDTELRQGSPGGYLASIQKDRLHQIGARSVQNDDSTQVPAMEMVFFNDDPTKGRG
ncbi:MAG TPA: hypothetical protein VM600_02315, partial [Actinomycetota bacterium]|nr:hypothetical protein [Actinomycetota bacterium]